MKQPTLKFLGNDSGFGNKNNSAYFEDKGEFFLLDCGFAVFGIIKERFDFSQYKNINIVITHLHNDHAGSLSQVVMYIWFTYGKTVNVMSACEKIQEYLEITGTVKDGYQIKRESKNLKFIKTQHVKEIDCYGLRIYLEGKNIVYTGDTNTLEPFKEYLKKADEFYVDVSKKSEVHLKIDDVLSQLEELSQMRSSCFLNAC